MEQAKGEAILVFDADSRVENDFINQLIPYLASEDVGAVQARKVIVNKDYNYLTRCQNNEYAMDCFVQVGRDSVKGAVELRGNGELIKRKALDRFFCQELLLYLNFKKISPLSPQIP